MNLENENINYIDIITCIKTLKSCLLIFHVDIST